MIKHGRRGCAAVAFAQGTSHALYEDRFRMLSLEAPLVRDAERGEVFAVFDGIGSAEKGREAAQLMCDRLTDFFKRPDDYPATWQGLQLLLMQANLEIHAWGMDEKGTRTQGGCAGTVAWAYGDDLWLFHAGDTMAVCDTGDAIYESTPDHQRNDGAITRFFGQGPDLRLDIDRHELFDYERILLMSDGVTKVMAKKQAALVVRETDDIVHAAREVVRLSLSRGSWDDITVMVVDVAEIE